jgi:multimeric flavodoxin WrbA
VKTITAVIGTPHVQGSATAALVSDFFTVLRERDPGIACEAIVLGTSRVGACNACWACSATGQCPLKDDLAAIQERILASDLLILGTPLHAGHVSAQTKAFIDRSFLWAHTVRLLGKPALTAVTSAFSDPSPAEDYLTGILVTLGALPMGGLRRQPFAPETLAPLDSCRRDHGALADRVIAVLSGRETLAPTPAHAASFETVKAMVRHVPGGFARSHWERRGWFDGGFAEALRAA